MSFHTVMTTAERTKICRGCFAAIFPSFSMIYIGAGGRLSAARKPASSIARN
jgi:hypothetical protein